MSLSDTAKDAIRLATTAGLGKDVIDLLTQKVTLLDEKLVEANMSLEQARLKISELISENKNLRSQLTAADAPSDRLHEKQEEILKLLHHSDSLSVEQIAGSIGLSAPDTKFHMDKLSEGEFVEFDINKSFSVNQIVRSSPLIRARGGYSGDGPKSLGHYYIKEKGREYVVTRTG